jgi:hypothetical protein
MKRSVWTKTFMNGQRTNYKHLRLMKGTGKSGELSFQ